ncbi:MAG TPA: SURF1 family cytochrome oxidase biogenesis protein, partial [Kangiella sp.]
QQADPGSPFVRQWELVASPPEKHIAYAVQWFGMALVLIILFIVLNLKRERQDESANG